jgi:TolB-like protein/cytochrome c-type biogenesis protein CcmH/NrfG
MRILRAVRLAVALVVACAGIAPVLRAQYPYVPPPVPCEPPNTRWGVGDESVGEDASLRRIAIVPFGSNFAAEDSANAALAAAFARRLVTRLTDLHAVGLWVPEPMLDSAQTARLETLGNAEHVRYVLVGYVGPATQGITVTAHLFRTTSHAAQVWSHTYSGPLTGLLAFETEIARSVASLVGSHARRDPAGSRPTASSAAYLTYLRGDADLRDERRGAAVSAMDEFSNAVALDSAFGEAWAGLAMSAVARLRREGGATPADDSALLGVATFAERHAQSLAPRSVGTWVARGAILEIQEPRNYANALAAYRRATDLVPWSAEAHRELGRALLNVGAVDAGIEQLRVSLRNGPGDPITWVDLANVHLMQRDYRGACHAADAAIESDPRHGAAYAARAYVRLRLKDIRNAYADAETGARLGAWLTGGVAAVIAAADARDTVSARQRLAALIAQVPHAATRLTVWEAQYLAKAYTTLGQNDRALALLAHARPHGASFWWALHDPGFDRLRYASAFGTLLGASEPVNVASAAPMGMPAPAAPPAEPGVDSSTATSATTTSASTTSATTTAAPAVP